MGGALFSAHMIQHEVLMLVAAPLLMLGVPMIALPWALPMHWRRRPGRWSKRPAVRRALRRPSHPLTAWPLYASPARGARGVIIIQGRRTPMWLCFRSDWRLAPVLMGGLCMLLGACDRGQDPGPARPLMYGGDPAVGATLIRSYGCGTCHTVPGIREADGKVGPPLTEFAHRSYIAGNLYNEPQNLILWIMDPQAIEPGTAMPTLGVTEAQARSIAAYLYTLR